ENHKCHPIPDRKGLKKLFQRLDTTRRGTDADDGEARHHDWFALRGYMGLILYLALNRFKRMFRSSVPKVTGQTVDGADRQQSRNEGPLQEVCLSGTRGKDQHGATEAISRRTHAQAGVGEGARIG